MKSKIALSFYVLVQCWQTFCSPACENTHCPNWAQQGSGREVGGDLTFLGLKPFMLSSFMESFYQGKTKLLKVTSKKRVLF